MQVRLAVDFADSPLLLILASWTLLASGSYLGEWIGRDAAVLVSFSAATILVCSTRPASSGGPPMKLRAGVTALSAGFASYPAWAALITIVGLALGLPVGQPTPPGAGGPALWAATLVLAPIFEELLYRERLLPVLCGRIGAPLAVVATSALFALPHLEPWNVLGTFLVGLMLGTIYLATESVSFCIALHAGLNLACLVCGVPPVRLALGPFASAGLGALLLAASLFWMQARPRAQSPSPCRSLETAHG
jgi:membrane protease YdiL (CAAX protease family)